MKLFLPVEIICQQLDNTWQYFTTAFKVQVQLGVITESVITVILLESQNIFIKELCLLYATFSVVSVL